MLTLDPMENRAWERIREVSPRWVAAEMVVPSWSAAEGKKNLFYVSIYMSYW